MVSRALTIPILIIPFMISVLRGQDFLKGTEEIKVDADYARFYGDSVQTHVEIYYGISEKMISYRYDSARYTGRIDFRLLIRNQSGVVAAADWFVSHTIGNSAKLDRPQTLLGLRSVSLPPGGYEISLHSVDGYDPGRADSVVIPLEIRSYPAGREFFSDIELCTSIKTSADKRSMFYKNTLEVIPNPSKLYGSGLPIMYYYTTAYNLLTGEDKSDLIIRTAVIDQNGTEVIQSEKSKARIYNSSVEVGTVNLSAVKTGSYLLRITLSDASQVVRASAEKRFFIYKYGSTPDTAASTAADFMCSKYSALNMEQVDRLFKQARYISSSFEKDRYDEIHDLKSKQSFICEFWRRRDTDRETFINEAEDAYYKRIEAAGRRFASGFREGWETDMGRIYVVFGQPDDIERFESTSESNPYQIWHFYNLQGGVLFVFVDDEGSGDYVLVHSTCSGELRDEEWYSHYAKKIH